MRRVLTLAMCVLLGGCGADDESADADAGHDAALDIVDDVAADVASDAPDVAADLDATDADPDTGVGDANDAAPDDIAEPDGAADATLDTDSGSPASPGCGRPSDVTPGGVQITVDAGAAGDGERGAWLSVPADYDPDIPSALIIGYPGTNWVGEQIQPYLGLEGDARNDEIFVYPDPLWRDFPGWGTLGGWTLGPWARPADGEQDLAFTAALIDYLERTYCIDTSRVFVTGHSWGGDMAQVAACFLGDRVTAAVPVAANRPYWFEPPGGADVGCVGDAAVWTLFGIADTHFTTQPYPGSYGDEQNGFWLDARDCEGPDAWTALAYGEDGECRSYEGCDQPVRYCLYGPDSGHQVPPYFADAAMTWFRSF